MELSVPISRFGKEINISNLKHYEQPVNYDALKYIQGQTKTIRKTNNTFCCLFVKKRSNVSYKNTNHRNHRTVRVSCSTVKQTDVYYKLIIKLFYKKYLYVPNGLRTVHSRLKNS